MARMVLEHFSEQAETAAAMEMEESMMMMEDEDEDEDGEEGRRSGFKFKLTDTDWSRIVESFCGLSITEATRPRLCHDVEIIAPSSVKALAAGDRSSPPPPGGLRDADYVAINVLDPTDSGVGVRNKLWMKEACPVTHQAMFVSK